MDTKFYEWGTPDAELIRDVQEIHFGRVDLWEASPIRWDDQPKTHEILSQLFSPTDTVGMCGLESRNYAWKTMAQWSAAPVDLFAGFSHISANSDKWRKRRFVVLEFADVSETRYLMVQEWIKTIRLAMVVEPLTERPAFQSWFYVEDASEEELREFFEIAGRLGCSGRWSNPFSLALLPQKPNRVLYLDPTQKNASGVEDPDASHEPIT